MAVQLKKTKPKKEKLAKAPKAPKAEKPLKKDSTAKVKISKPAKAPKPTKIERPAKVKKEPQVKIKQAKPSKGAQSPKTVNMKKGGASGAKKPRNVKAIVGISVIVVVAVALAAVALMAIIGVNEQNNEVDYIFISSTPNKMVYYVGEEASYDGLRVIAVSRNGKQTEVPISECKITGFDNTAPAEQQTVSVEYKNFAATFFIVVNELPKPTPVLVRIYLEELPKTEYKIGERLETNGGIIVREYKDGTTKRITLVNNYVYGWKAAKEAFEAGVEGPYTLTVKYKENGILAETTYEITITE